MLIPMILFVPPLFLAMMALLEMIVTGALEQK